MKGLVTSLRQLDVTYFIGKSIIVANTKGNALYCIVHVTSVKMYYLNLLVLGTGSFLLAYLYLLLV